MTAPWPVSQRRLLAWALLALGAALALALSQALPAPFFALIPLGCVVLLVVLRAPLIAPLLLVASVPAQQLGAAGPLTATRACVLLTLGAWGIALLVQREPLRLQRFEWAYVLLLGVMALSVVQAASWRASVAEIVRWGIAFVALLALTHFFARADVKRALALALVVAACGALEALYGLEQTARAAGPASFQIGAVSRAYGAFGRPNSFAGYLELTLFPPLWLGVHYLTRLPRALSEYRSARLRGLAASRPERARLCWTAALAGGLLGCAALILGGIVASFSRGAWLGVALAGLVTVLLYARWTRVVTLALAPLAALLLLGGAAHVVPASVSGRLGSIVDEARPFDASTITITPENFAAVERMAHWQAGWHMFTHHPALGVGVGNFNTRYPDYYVRATFRVSQGHAHNIYIQMLAETGIAGLFAYLILILSFLWLALWIVIHAPNGFARMLALGAFGTQLSVAAHNVFEDLEVLNLGVQLAAIWVLTLAALCLWRQGRATADLASVEYCPS